MYNSDIVRRGLSPDATSKLLNSTAVGDRGRVLQEPGRVRRRCLSVLCTVILFAVWGLAPISSSPPAYVVSVPFAALPLALPEAPVVGSSTRPTRKTEAVNTTLKLPTGTSVTNMSQWTVPISAFDGLKGRCGELAVLPLPLPPTPGVSLPRGRKPPPPPKSLLPRQSPDERRLLVVSVGGVGTSTLISEMIPRLEQYGVVVNDINDVDGLKHPWFSECTLQRARRFGADAVLYILGDPAAATYSHFRRGWAGAQMCKITPHAEASLTDRILGPIFQLNAKSQKRYKTAAALSWADFARWVGDPTRPSSESGREPFGYVAHAQSWRRGAADLGVPLWFTTLEDLAADPAPIARLLRLPPNATANASDPLFRLTLRPPSYRPDGLPQSFIDTYARARDELWALRGTCFEVLDPSFAIPATQSPSRTVRGAHAPTPASESWTPGNASATVTGARNDSNFTFVISGSRCSEAGLVTVFVDPPVNGSAFDGTGPGTVGGDPAYRFLEQAQVREGSECWKLMRTRLSWRPTRLRTQPF